MQLFNPDAIVEQQLAQALQHCQAGRLAQAWEIYLRIMTQSPQRTEPYLNCGEICLAQNQYEEALTWFRKAQRLQPNFPPALKSVGQTLLALGKPEEALSTFEKLLSLAPQSDMASRGIGEALSQLGRISEARVSLERAVALAPHIAGHHYALAQVARFVENDTRLPGLERLKACVASLSPPAQCDLHFALAKAYDELGRREQAFSHWQNGNAVKHRYVGYNEEMFLGMLKALAEAFPINLIKKKQNIGASSNIPIFVVGMPRSGTTLVEQILASHPFVHGAGESMYLHQLLGQDIVGRNFPFDFSTVADDDIKILGERYVAQMSKSAPQSKRIVDKLTANFMLCGLIHLALPNAHIVHVRRDPRDTCFSCYTNIFAQNFDYTYDLSELGRFYRAYDKLMAHWRSVIPPTVLLDVQYEDLVTDFEPQVRRLIAFCDLPWHDDCLTFHKTKRVVHTLSAAQVRQPLYQTSIGRWQPYATHLTPLFDALGVTV